MSAKKIITVIGATGNQGSSVVKAFLGLPNWHVRAITRNASSESAQALKGKGAEIVQADLRDPASLPPALAGANTVFLNTDFWGVYRPLRAKLEEEKKDIEEASRAAYENETVGGKNAIDALAGVSTLERLVISSVPSASRMSGGKYPHSKHTEAKQWILDYAEENAVLKPKISVIYLGAYNTNPFLVPQKHPATGRNTFAIPLPETREMPLIDAAGSTGAFVRELVENEAVGTKLLAYDGRLTPSQMVESWKKGSGKEADMNFITTKFLEEKMGVAREHLDAFDAIIEFGNESAMKGVLDPSQLKNKVKTDSFEDWVRATQS